MKLFRTWEQVLPKLFTADGTNYGLVTIDNTAGFYVGMACLVKADTLPNKTVQVKKVLSRTQMIVGPLDNNLNSYTAINFYTTALNANIEASEQEAGLNSLKQINDGDVISGVYEYWPIGALRVHLVDQIGETFTLDNRLPVTTDRPDPITDLEPDVNFIYGAALEVVEIREFAVDSQVGDPLKRTILSYGSACEVTRIRQEVSEVEPEDL